MKDILGLIKYIAITFFIIIQPLLICWLWAITDEYSYYDYALELAKFIKYAYENNNLFSVVYGWFTVIITIMFPITYLWLPFKITKKAIKEHSSKYLDFFFNNIFLMTLLLIFIVGAIEYPLLSFDENIEAKFIILQTACFFIVPVYIMVYSTAIVQKIRNSKLFKNAKQQKH